MVVVVAPCASAASRATSSFERTSTWEPDVPAQDVRTEPAATMTTVTNRATRVRIARSGPCRVTGGTPVGRVEAAMARHVAGR